MLVRQQIMFGTQLSKYDTHTFQNGENSEVQSHPDVFSYLFPQKNCTRKELDLVS